MLSVQRQQGLEKSRLSTQRVPICRRASEVELLALACGEGVTRLCGLRDLIEELPRLGKVKVVTRNRQAVLEKVNRYQTIKLLGPQGFIQGDTVSLRLFLSHWHYGFAVKEKCDDGFRYSLQFFDRDGSGVHRIYLTEESCWKAYRNLITCYRSPDQSPRQSVSPVPHLASRGAGEIDIALLRRSWLCCQDIHDLPAIFQSLGISRIQALRLAGQDLAVPVTLPDLRVFMEVLRDAAMPVTFCVGNRGVAQRQAGVVKRVSMAGSWCIVLDSDFTLYLRETKTLQAWIVRQPAGGDITTSLELYNGAGENVLQLFSQCVPGQAAIGGEIWQRLLAALETAPMLVYSSALQAV